jgi:fatty-acyl-CoA synthase
MPTNTSSIFIASLITKNILFENKNKIINAVITNNKNTTISGYSKEGDSEFDWQLPSDEWDAIALNYTSGTTGDPKGVVYHHRGAAINALSNILEWDMPKHAVYLWTLPMFH